MKVVQGFAAVLLVVVAALFAYNMVSSGKRLSDLSNTVGEQNAARKEIVQKKGELEREAKQVGEKMKSLPDSIAGLGIAMKESRRIGTLLDNLDVSEKRIRKKLRDIEDEQAAIEAGRKKRNLGLGAVFITLAVLLAVLRKFQT